MQQQEQQIFKKGSTTFFLSSLFFPQQIKADVFDLYSFVRVADDYVDQVPSDSAGFHRLRKQWEQAISNKIMTTERSEHDDTDTRVIKNMLRVSRKYNFDPAWTTAFLDSMQSDITGKKYDTLDDMLWYIYGSAEVIGLMMANIMRLPPEATEAAKLQGRAMQIINFIRDINEDITLGRQYFPETELRQFGLTELSPKAATENPEQYNAFIQFQIDRYNKWQDEAYQGYQYIPRRLRIPLHTATDMYNWTAKKIERNPTIVFDQKVKPNKGRVTTKALTNIVKFAIIK